MEKKQRIKEIRHVMKSTVIGLICIFTLTALTACGAKDSEEAWMRIGFSAEAIK